jgi:hypothetical protein
MTMKGTIALRETAQVTITTLVDNYIDTLLPSTDHVKRAPLMKGKVRTGHLLAEHGIQTDLFEKRMVNEFENTGKLRKN